MFSEFVGILEYLEYFVDLGPPNLLEFFLTVCGISRAPLPPHCYALNRHPLPNYFAFQPLVVLRSVSLTHEITIARANATVLASLSFGSRHETGLV